MVPAHYSKWCISGTEIRYGTRSVVHSHARAGVNAPAVRIEVLLSGGLPHTQMVGLPETAVRESRDRLRAAIACSQFEFPQRRITINLAPADLPKEGGRFDLAIALGILAASGQIDTQVLSRYQFLGELALAGELRGVNGVLPAALAAARLGRTLIVPPESAAEAGLAGHADVRVARTLLEACAGLSERTLPKALPADVASLPMPDLRDVRGQPQARRALEVAAAGGHHLLLIGTPGCGKTLLASRLPGILPDATELEALETATVASCTGGGIDTARWRQRPYRSTASSPVGLPAYPFEVQPLMDTLALEGTLVNVGLGEPPGLNTFAMAFGRKRLAGSMTGGIAETQAVIDHCFAHGIAPDVEMITPDQINTAFDRVVDKDVRYRFVIDFASRKQAFASTPDAR